MIRMDDGSRPYLSILLIVLLLAGAVYFALAETAFASVSRVRIKARADRGERRAKRALYILDHIDKAITTVLIGTNIFHLTTAAFVTVLVTRRWGISAVTVGTLVTTLVVFFIGEMLPKSIAKKYSERLSLATAGSLYFFMGLFSPISWFLTKIGAAAARISPSDPELTVTEDELYDIIENMTDEGSISEERGELVSSALEFADIPVESVLTARVDVAAIDVDDEPEEILATIRAQRHSRIPVYEGSIDHVIGVLQIRKYIRACVAAKGPVQDIRPLLDETMFVHHSKTLDDLLPEMSRRKVNLAVVTDNYGGMLGIVTVEDILEELVGEIWDEDDVVEEPIVEITEGVFEVESDESVSDVFERLDYEDPEENEELINTLMGEWAYEQFTAIPKIGDSFRYHRVSVTVSSMDHNRILKLRVTLLPEEKEGGGAT